MDKNIDSKTLAIEIAKILDKKKAQDVRVLKVDSLTVLTDYFVIASGTSTTQVGSLADEVEYELSQSGIEPHTTEGFDSKNWVLLDYSSVIVHVFVPNTRTYYDLEHLWADGEPIDRLLFATFLKGRTSSRDVWEEKGDMTPEDNQKIIEETNEIINDDSTYPFISYLSDLLAKSKPSDDAVKKLHDCIDKVAVALGHDSTDVFRALLAKLIEEPEEKQTFDRLLEMAENLAAKH